LVEAVPLRKRTYKTGAHPHNLHPESHISITHPTSPDYKAMGGPRSGRYSIQLDLDPKPLAGVSGVAPVLPVITGGRTTIWIVTKLQDEDYTLVLENDGRFVYIKDDNGNIIGSDTPPAVHWTIKGPDNGPYTIEIPGGIWPARGWVVDSPEPNQLVTLGLFETPLPTQRWNFLPILNE